VLSVIKKLKHMQEKIEKNKSFRITFPDGNTTIIEANTAYGASLIAERLYPQYERCEVETHSVEHENNQRYADLILENNTIL
jgi:hypothetical protein